MLLPTVEIITGGSANYSRQYEYDNLNHVTAVINENNQRTEILYDGRYLKTQQTNALTDNYQWLYDENGNLIEEINEENQSTTYVYDKQNRASDKYPPESHHWHYDYDGNGNLTSSTDPWGFSTTNYYDKVNQPQRITTPAGDENMVYTADGLMVFHQDVELRQSTQLYTVDGRLIKSTDPVGRVSEQEYDVNGNPTKSTLSWISAVTGPTQTITQQDWDVLDRLKTRTDALSTGIQRVTGYDYDNVGNLLMETRPEGRVTRYGYDALNRANLVTDAKTHTVKTVYDG